VSSTNVVFATGWFDSSLSEKGKLLAAELGERRRAAGRAGMP